MTAHPDHCSIAIVGAGPVGLELALQLVRRGVAASEIAVIDARALEKAVNDPRAIALSYGSRQLLEEIDCWPIAADAIEHIHVSRRGRFGRTLIDAEELHVPALGYVARYGAVVATLARALEDQGIRTMRPRHLTSFAEHADAVTLRFADGGELQARILVQAEGGVFSEQDAKALHRDYGQSAVIAHVHADEACTSTAYERFTDEGPLALLPQDGGYALVWCMRPESAGRIQALDDAGFLAELQTAFGGRVGRFTRVSPRHVYPLGLNAQPAATARTVAIGNAAQTLHPVAGQGLNLGLRDAAVLAQALATSTETEAETPALAHFLARRRIDRGAIIHLTDLLARIFANPLAPAQSLLGLSLGVVDALPPAKRLLAEHMMFGHR
ncbi:MAG TPA: UbiH/UbiF/VisC/COQ6 family ubiquinone biosynthesis hydroxylase [Noviherbaspirillum sp.]